MLKKIYRAAIICPLILISTYILASETNIPGEFTVNERLTSCATTFDIKDNSDSIGTVQRKAFSLLPEYHLLDSQENLLAKAKMHLLSHTAIFDVEDDKENKLGSVEQKFSYFFPAFRVLSPNGEVLCEAIFNFWRTVYTLSDPADGHAIATLSRPFYQFKKEWTINVVDSTAISIDGIHPYLFMTLAAFQIDNEYWEAQRKKQQQSEHNLDVELELSVTGLGLLLSSEEESSNELREILEIFQRELGGLGGLGDYQPTEDDFKTIEAMTKQHTVPMDPIDEWSQHQQLMEEMLWLLSSEHLTPQQKAALLIMLKTKRPYDHLECAKRLECA